MAQRSACRCFDDCASDRGVTQMDARRSVRGRISHCPSWAGHLAALARSRGGVLVLPEDECSRSSPGSHGGQPRRSAAEPVPSLPLDGGRLLLTWSGRRRQGAVGTRVADGPVGRLPSFSPQSPCCRCSRSLDVVWWRGGCSLPRSCGSEPVARSDPPRVAPCRRAQRSPPWRVRHHRANDATGPTHSRPCCKWSLVIAVTDSTASRRVAHRSIEAIPTDATALRHTRIVTRSLPATVVPPSSCGEDLLEACAPDPRRLTSSATTRAACRCCSPVTSTPH